MNRLVEILQKGNKNYSIIWHKIPQIIHYTVFYNVRLDGWLQTLQTNPWWSIKRLLGESEETGVKEGKILSTPHEIALSSQHFTYHINTGALTCGSPWVSLTQTRLSSKTSCFNLSVGDHGSWYLISDFTLSEWLATKTIVAFSDWPF